MGCANTVPKEAILDPDVQQSDAQLSRPQVRGSTVDEEPGSLIDGVCCTSTLALEDVIAAMLSSEPLEASIFEQLCLCHSRTQKRVTSLEGEPELAGLAGLMLLGAPNGNQMTGIQTLKYARFSASSRKLFVSAYGGVSGRGQQGTWARAPHTNWRLTICVARSCDLGYEVQFSEDFRHAQLVPQVNCCCCLPCVPACVRIGCMHIEWVQSERSTHGTEWLQEVALCGARRSADAAMRTVVNADGSAGPFYEIIAEQAARPTALVLTR